jgi:hypothetical protein
LRERERERERERDEKTEKGNRCVKNWKCAYVNRRRHITEGEGKVVREDFIN